MPDPFEDDKFFARGRWPDERIDDLAEIVRNLTPISTAVALATTQLANLSTDLVEIKEECQATRSELADANKARAESRNRIIIAALMASATVMAAIVAAIATILAS